MVFGCDISCLVFLFLSVAVYTQHQKPPFSIVYKSGYIDLHDPVEIKFIKMPRGYHSVSHYEIIVTDELAFVHHFNSERERAEKSPGAKNSDMGIYLLISKTR